VRDSRRRSVGSRIDSSRLIRSSSAGRTRHPPVSRRLQPRARPWAGRRLGRRDQNHRTPHPINRLAYGAPGGRSGCGVRHGPAVCQASDLAAGCRPPARAGPAGRSYTGAI